VTARGRWLRSFLAKWLHGKTLPQGGSPKVEQRRSGPEPSPQEAPPGRTWPVATRTSTPALPTVAPGEPIGVEFRRPRRIIQVGVDYGTSWSKLVFRDEQARGKAKSWIVRRGEVNGQADFRIPSLVALDNGRLYFGNEAADRQRGGKSQVWQSLKVRAAFPGEFHALPTPLPQGFTAADLATLTVHHLLQEAGAAIAEYAAESGIEPVTTMRLGVPLPALADQTQRQVFLRIAKEASLLEKRALISNGTRGLPLDDASTALAFVRSHQPEETGDDVYQWLLPELVAGLIWAFFSPTVGPGLYAAVDVGAGSTDAAFFRIVPTYDSKGKAWQKSLLSLWGGGSHPSGVDTIDQELAQIFRVEDQLALRLREAGFLERLDAQNEEKLKRCYEKIFDVYRSAFRAAYRKDMRQGQWQDYGLFLFGGGSLLQPLQRKLDQPAIPHFGDNLQLVDPGVPDDLGGVQDPNDALFALVAYGLTYGLSFADFELPADVPPREIDPRLQKRRLEEDELSEEVLLV
jgi:hypothetical protein